MLEKVSLKSALVPLPRIIGPLNFHESSGLTLPPDNSILQHQLADLDYFTAKTKMKINYKKTKIISFNFSKKFSFVPQLGFPNTDPLEVIYNVKLLGVTITSDLSWSAHITNITRRATKNLWVLIRFKNLGGTTDQLSIVYQTRIRTILEFAAPVFHSSLTKEQSSKIEMIQKKALAVILGKNYNSYEEALTKLNLEKLEKRRADLCRNFAEKCAKSTRHASMFPKNNQPRVNMRRPKLYEEFNCNTSRYYNSSIPYMARLLNQIT